MSSQQVVTDTRGTSTVSIHRMTRSDIFHNWDSTKRSETLDRAQLIEALCGSTNRTGTLSTGVELLKVRNNLSIGLQISLTLLKPATLSWCLGHTHQKRTGNQGTEVSRWPVLTAHQNKRVGRTVIVGKGFAPLRIIINQSTSQP